MSIAAYSITDLLVDEARSSSALRTEPYDIHLTGRDQAAARQLSLIRWGCEGEGPCNRTSASLVARFLAWRCAAMRARPVSASVAATPRPSVRPRARSHLRT